MSTVLSRLYSAFRYTSPSVPVPLSEAQRIAITDRVSTLTNHAQQLVDTGEGRLQRAQSSSFTGQLAHLSPAATWLVAFGSMLASTIDSWEDASAGARAEAIIALLALAATAAHAGIIYIKNRRQSACIEQRSQELAALTSIRASLLFLKKSEKMARTCLDATDLATLRTTYNAFESYLHGLEAGVVPNDLSAAWTAVSFALAEEKELEEIRASVESRILPLTRHYVNDAKRALTPFLPPPIEETP
jgi:hypothetical protein